MALFRRQLTFGVVGDAVRITRHVEVVEKNVWKRGVSSSSAVRVGRRGARAWKSNKSEDNVWKSRQRREAAFDWHGMRRGMNTSSTWTVGSRRGQPQRSNATGVLGVLFGVSAVAVLSSPIVGWIKEHAIDVDEEDGVGIDGIDG
jgi:sulfite oxidase